MAGEGRAVERKGGPVAVAIVRSDLAVGIPIVRIRPVISGDEEEIHDGALVGRRIARLPHGGAEVNVTSQARVRMCKVIGVRIGPPV